MYVTNEFARSMLCGQSGHKRLKCVAEACMGWRGLTLYASFVRTPDAKKGTTRTNYQWTLTQAEGAHAVDCGYCGYAGAPTISVEMVAPLGYDPTSLVGLTGSGHAGTPARSVNKFEKELLKKRGLLPTDDDGHRSPTGRYYHMKKRIKP